MFWIKWSVVLMELHQARRGHEVRFEKYQKATSFDHHTIASKDAGVCTNPKRLLRLIGVKPALGAANVAVGSKADLTAPKSDFRFTPENGLKSDIGPCPKSARRRHSSLFGLPELFFSYST